MNSSASTQHPQPLLTEEAKERFVSSYVERWDHPEFHVNQEDAEEVWSELLAAIAPKCERCGGSGRIWRLMKDGLPAEPFAAGSHGSKCLDCEGTGRSPLTTEVASASTHGTSQAQTGSSDQTAPQHDPERPGQPGTEGGPGAGADSGAAGSRAGEPQPLAEGTGQLRPRLVEEGGQVECECCGQELPGQCAATGAEGESLCGACTASLDAPIIKAAFAVADGKESPEKLRALLDDAYQRQGVSCERCKDTKKVHLTAEAGVGWRPCPDCADLSSGQVEEEDSQRERDAQLRHEELAHSASESFTRCPDPGCQIEAAETAGTTEKPPQQVSEDQPGLTVGIPCRGEAERVTLYRPAAMNGEEKRVGAWSTDKEAVAHLGEEVETAEFVRASEESGVDRG